MDKITSAKNQKIKALKKLHSTKGRKESGLYLIEGEHLYLEALENDVEIKEILISEKYLEKQAEWPEKTTVVTDEVMKILTQTETAPGIICVLEMPTETMPHDLIGKFILLDGVQDPGNAGTIVRTADAGGFQGVIFGTGSVDPYNDKVLRSMQGSHFHIPIYRSDLIPVIADFKERNIPVYGTALDERASDFRALPKKEDLALVLGNEGNGVSSRVLEQTTQNLYIPIIGKAESLNVAIAAGILMYHFV